jgi:DNA primase
MPQAKKKPAARKQPPTRVQTDRKPGSPDPEVTKELDQVEETQEERDAAGAARREHVLTPGRPLPPDEYEPDRPELENAGFDHHSAEERRQAELQAERDLHNERTGDASLKKGTWS